MYRLLPILLLSQLAACSLWQKPATPPDLQDLAAGAPLAPEITRQAAVLAGELATRRGLDQEAAAQYAIAARHSDDPLIAARATQLALAAEDEALAAQATARWIALDEDNPGAHEIAARLALRAGQAQAAQRHLLRRAQLSPQGAGQGIVEVAQILAAEPEMAATASQLLDGVAQGIDAPAETAYARALLAFSQDDAAAAEAAINSALQRRPDWREPQLLALRLHLAAGNATAAERRIRDLHVAAPRDLELRLALGRLLLEHDQLALARQEFRGALKISPDNTSAIYALALIGVDSGDFTEARRYFRALLDRGVRREDAAFYLGRIAEQEKDYDEALRWYREVDEGHRVLDAVIRQAVVISRQGELAAARSMLNNLRGRYPQHELRLYEVEAELLYQAGRMDAAKATYDAALTAYPEDLDLFYGRALAQEQLGDIAGAESDLQTILAREPDNARALNALGYILSNHSRRYEEAMAYVRQALELTPDDAAVIDSMGWLHYRLGDLERAREYLERAYAKLPDPEIAAHLGEVLWVLGEQQRARAIWSEALAQNPEHPALNETRQRLDSAI